MKTRMKMTKSNLHSCHVPLVSCIVIMHSLHLHVCLPLKLLPRVERPNETLLDSGTTVNLIDERLPTKECAHVCSVSIIRVMFHVVAMYRLWAGLNP